jgi:zinc finger FYVE domain-containing protein 1
MEPTRSTESMGSIPDLLFDAEKDLTSINIFEDYPTNDSNSSKSVLLLDSDEILRISNVGAFIKKLGISDENKAVKVVSIFGNSGDGKSHTLNHVFFKGEEIFKTSSEQVRFSHSFLDYHLIFQNSQNSCTLGVSCSFQPSNSVLCLDTEGFNGPQNENKRMRMLLKVLAVSDIIIYRTRAERIHSEMFNFLATANKVWWKHFSPILNPSTSSKTLGPDVVIFHETRNTKPLESSEYFILKRPVFSKISHSR